jgi:hypothetical protein
MPRLEVLGPRQADELAMPPFRAVPGCKQMDDPPHQYDRRRRGIRISEDGFLDIGNNVNGVNVARMNDNGAWSAMSDRRIKKHIEPAVGNLDAATRLRAETCGMVKEEASRTRVRKSVPTRSWENLEVSPPFHLGIQTRSPSHRAGESNVQMINIFIKPRTCKRDDSELTTLGNMHAKPSGNSSMTGT